MACRREHAKVSRSSPYWTQLRSGGRSDSRDGRQAYDPSFVLRLLICERLTALAPSIHEDTDQRINCEGELLCLSGPIISC